VGCSSGVDCRDDRRLDDRSFSFWEKAAGDMFIKRHIGRNMFIKITYRRGSVDLSDISAVSKVSQFTQAAGQEVEGFHWPSLSLPVFRSVIVQCRSRVDAAERMEHT